MELDSDGYPVLAKIIRKEFGLCDQNETLISCCQNYLGSIYDSYEDPAMAIIEELRKKVRRDRIFAWSKAERTPRPAFSIIRTEDFPPARGLR